MDLFSNEKCKKFTSTCLNREIKSHQMNNVQERLLRASNNKFDKSLRKESKTQRFHHEGLQREQTSIQSRTPSIAEWMKKNQRHHDAWKERERQMLERRHKYSIRQYKVPNFKLKDDGSMNMTMCGTAPIGKVRDPEESGTNGDLDSPRPSTSSAVRRTHSLIDRPKTSGTRRATLAEVHPSRGARRHSTAVFHTRDVSSSHDGEDDVYRGKYIW